MTREGRHSFGRLRNELGRRDWFTWVTFFSFLFCPDLGWAGTLGFRAHRGTRNAVDNVRIPEVTRNDRFIQEDRVRQLWLPFLWGIDPEEYQVFTVNCSVASRIEAADPSDPQVKLLEEELGSTHWNFLGRTLYKEIIDRVQGVSQRDMKYAVSQIRIHVAFALQEEKGSRKEEILQSLRPQVAIRNAVRLLKSNGIGGPTPSV